MIMIPKETRREALSGRMEPLPCRRRGGVSGVSGVAASPGCRRERGDGRRSYLLSPARPGDLVMSPSVGAGEGRSLRRRAEAQRARVGIGVRPRSRRRGDDAAPLAPLAPLARPLRRPRGEGLHSPGRRLPPRLLRRRHVGGDADVRGAGLLPSDGPGEAEEIRPFVVEPPVSVELEEEVLVLPDHRPRVVRARRFGPP